MEKIKRAVHFDFHNMPGIDNFGETFDAEKFAERLRQCHVDYINMFARCNIGFSYYPTKLGTVYPNMKGNLLGDVIKECHKRGIGVTAYLNGGLNHQLMIDKPEFMKVHKDGTVYKADKINDNFFRSPCFNTGYRQYLLDEIKEILQQNPDGIFCDCLMPESCYCPSCIKKMNELGIDVNDDSKVFAFALDTLREVFSDIRAVVPKDKRLILNSHPYDDLYWHQSHVEVECLPTDAQWGYDYLPAIAPYYRHFKDNLIYMNGRFVRGWNDFGGVKTRAAIENDVYDALFFGYAPSIGDRLHPAYGMDDELFDIVKDTYDFVMSLEAYTDNTAPKVEAAILRNKITHKNARSFLSEGDRGAARMLSELKVSYDVVNEDMEFGKYKLLVIPDNIDITDKLNDKLKNFRGSILSSGKSFRQDGIWDYLTEVSDDESVSAYYQSGSNVRAMYTDGIKMKSEYSIADRIEPYYDAHFDGLHAYCYLPYRKSEGYSAVALCGNRAHISFKVFESYLKYGGVFHKKLVEKILDTLLPERIISSDSLPSSTRVSVLTSDNHDILHIKSTYPEHRGKIGVVEEHNVLASGAEITIDGEYSQVYTIPQKEGVEFNVSNGKTQITLPEICGYQAFCLEK